MSPSPIRVLILDADPTYAEILQSTLALAGADVQVAATVPFAIRALQIGARPQVIFLDLAAASPAQGWLVAAWLHTRTPRMSPLPWSVGLITRSDAHLSAQMGRRAGCQRILPKEQLMLQLGSLLALVSSTVPPPPPPITEPAIFSALAALPPCLVPASCGALASPRTDMGHNTSPPGQN